MGQRRLSRVGISAFQTALPAKPPRLAPVLAKTSRPQVADVYPRSQLFAMLDLARKRLPATLVSGPPGSGKTTLMSSYLDSRQLPCLWYRLDSGDDDVATFFHYFSEAARMQGVDRAVALPAFEPGAGTDLAKFSRRYFREFYAGTTSPAVSVLDNYHELAVGSPLHQVIHVACEETPAGHHVVIVGRNECPESLTRMRLNRDLMVIDADDLALTLEETRGIADLQGVKLPSSAATLSLHIRSAGWVMGLMLLLESIRRNARLDTNVALQAGQEELVFAYFAGEVFKTLDDQCRNLLLQMALLPKMTIRRVNQLTRTTRAGALLREPTRTNNFVFRHEGREAAYEFHPLFRAFLLRTGRRDLQVELPVLQSRAAEVLLTDGEDEAALDLLEQAHDGPRMAAVLLALAPSLKAQGRDATLALWLNKLPSELIDADPWLRFWKGSSTTDPEASQQILEDVYRRFLAVGDVLGMALSWTGLMNAIFSIHKDLRQMDDWVTEFDTRLALRLDELPPDLEASVTLAYFDALTFRQPLHPSMSEWLQKVLARLASERRAEERALLRFHVVRHYLLRGHHAEAEAALSALQIDADTPASRRSARFLPDQVSEAMVAMHLGMHERCFNAVEAGLQAAESNGDRLSQSILLQLGAAMSLNREEPAITDAYLRGFERLAEALPFVDRGCYYAVAAWRRYHRGEPVMALHFLRRAVAASEARGTGYFIAVDNLGYGLLLHLCGDSDAARRHLDIGRSVGASIRNALIEFAYQLFSAYLALDSREHDKLLHHLKRAMEMGREHGYMHFFYFPPKLIAKLCLEALQRGLEPGYVQALIQRNGLTPDPSWRQSEAWPWPIRIYTLGRFSVVKDGQQMRFAGKAQKKPMELLKVLIALGGRDVAESRLADALWPEAEGDAAAQALATTLFRLRRLLGEQAIHRQEGRVTLDSGLCWVDCWEFERVSSDDSLDPPQRLAKLQRLYQGNFLDGTDEAPWAQPLRERLYARLARLAPKSIFPWFLMGMQLL
jgi:LuxR family transcriptional regulator, maltose regulon positive regulatory protein